jgi:acetyl esterase/lipase
MKRIIAITILIVATCNTGFAQQVIRLYEGKAPGSENWNWEEKQNNNNAIHLMTVFNVVNPTLTVYQPDASVANGTGVIICPGGGFHFLSIESEGNEVAKWLAKKGFTAFVLKYRVAHINTDDPFGDMMSGMNGPRKKEWEAENKATIPLCIADGKAAIVYVRSHAAEYKIKTDRIGIIGFSAGGTVTASSMFNYTKENRPDFAAPVYAYMPDEMQGNAAADAPPMFLVCATDDQLGLTTHSISLYNKWYAAKHSVEMHLYAKGGHGFGMNVQNIPTDNWIERFYDWLKYLGYAIAK